MSGLVRPIRLPGAAALGSLRERAAVALDVWIREWVSDAPTGEASGFILCSGVTTHTQTSNFKAVCAEEGCMWFRRSDADRERLARAVVGAEVMPDIGNADSWIVSVVEQACNDRDRALCSALLGRPLTDSASSVSVIPVELFAFGSGAVELSCEWLGLHAVVDSAVWRKIPPTARDRQSRLPKAASLDTAIRQARARLEVVLGSVEVELPKVLDLQYGDVLRLPQRLDQPITVFCEGKPLARAALGECGGRKSVQLLSNHP